MLKTSALYERLEICNTHRQIWLLGGDPFVPRSESILAQRGHSKNKAEASWLRAGKVKAKLVLRLV